MKKDTVTLVQFLFWMVIITTAMLTMYLGYWHK